MKTCHLFIRVVAAVMDSLLVCLLWYYFIDSWGHADGGSKVVTGAPAMVLMLLTASYWMIPEWILGATFGKLALGLRVATLAGQPISFGQSFKRNFLRLADFSLST